MAARSSSSRCRDRAGQGVFLVGSENMSNINQMIEAITRDGYIIAQAYVPAASKGDIRFFLMNGVPLQIGKKYAALRRVSAKDDIRSNIHAGGKAVAVEIGETRAAHRRADPAQAHRRRHVPGRDRHRRRQDPRGERVQPRQPPQLQRPRRASISPSRSSSRSSARSRSRASSSTPSTTRRSR